MAKDEKTIGNITYYGIATRRDINKLLNSEEFAPPFDQCLSKGLAATCTTIKVTDTDPNPGKLLRYNSIELANRTITLKIYNNSAYSLTLYSISIKFTIDGVIYEQSPDVRADTVAPRDTKNITITNYREKVPMQDNATLQLSIDCFYYDKPSGAATVQFYVPGSNNKFDIFIGPYTNTEIDASKTLTNSGYMASVNNKYEWQWIKKEINTYWLATATEIQFEVKIS